jgi:hypothetical protein
MKVYASRETLAYQRGEGSSSIATTTFPSLLNYILSMVRDSKNISWSYYMSVPGGEVFGASFTKWTTLAFLLGIVIPSTSTTMIWRYVNVILILVFLIDSHQREAWLALVSFLCGKYVKKIVLPYI